MTAVEAFHAHLDVCHRCETQPFNLCPTGARLILAAVDSLPASLAPNETSVDKSGLAR